MTITADTGAPSAPLFPPGVEVIPRDQFLTEYWDYRRGEHVTVLGPTGSGKTWLAYQLLAVTAHPKMPGVVLVMKPRDETVTKWSKAAQFRRVQTWPPVGALFQGKPSGYVLWPKHTFDTDIDDANLSDQFRKALIDCYKRGDRIVFADEVHGLTNELALGKSCVALWKRGRSMGTGLWAASQRPAHIPLDAYSQSDHLFIAHDPDKRARDRYAEIGGMDPELIKQTTMALGRHQFAYVRRDGAHLCVVDA